MMRSHNVWKTLVRIFAVLISSFLIFMSVNHFVLKPTSPDICPGVLAGMMTGKWRTKPFLSYTHPQYRLPKNYVYQRKDGLCGNVTFHETKLYRALCDPEGTIPCCFDNKCTSKTRVECECEDCYDMRKVKHAEYSTWIPSHPGCIYHEHTSQEACDILDGMDIAFVGDSLVRHVYTAMLLVVTGNKKDGAMIPAATNASRQVCQGITMFTGKVCRGILQPLLVACDGKVRLSIHYHYRSMLGRKFLSFAKKFKPSFLIAGIGIHDKYDHNRVQNLFLKPLLSFLKSDKRKAIQLLWMAHHALGLFNSPMFSHQNNENVTRFNKRIERFLKPWNIPIFDTYQLTEGMASFDGIHYGMGINVVKANILLSYIKEQKEQHK